MLILLRSFFVMCDCLFHCVYKEHGFSVDCCTLVPFSDYRDLSFDVDYYNKHCPCSSKLTLDDVRAHLLFVKEAPAAAPERQDKT